MARIEHEARAAVVEQNAGLLGADRRAERREQRIDQRDRAAVAVDHGKIDGVAAGRGRRAAAARALRGRASPQAVLANALSLSASTATRMCDGSAMWVSRTAKPRRAASSIRWKRSGPSASSDARSKFSRMLSATSAVRPLRVRRDLDQIDAAIIGRDRRHRLAAMPGEVLGGEHRACRGKRRRHVVGDRAFVERARAVFGDGLQRLRQRRQPDDVAFGRRAAVRQIVLGRAGAVAELADQALPVVGDARGDREAVLGVFDRGRQHAVERPGAAAP